MTAITLFQGVRKFTNVALPTGTREIITLYTVPAALETMLTEGFFSIEGGANQLVQLYILIAGGTDYAGLTNNDVGEIFDTDLGVSALLAQAIGVVIPANQPPYSFEITRAHVMRPGDSLRMNIINQTGGDADVTDKGITGLISGLEFGP